MNEWLKVNRMFKTIGILSVLFMILTSNLLFGLLCCYCIFVFKYSHNQLHKEGNVKDASD